MSLAIALLRTCASRTALVALALAAPVVALAACPPGMVGFGAGHFRFADESQQAEVRAFCIDRTEVTAQAYAACVRSGTCGGEGLDCGKAATYEKKGKADHPINCVQWFEADTYCRSRGKRLPTEAEWEWAARGGPRGARYPWGEAEPASRACWDGEGNSEGKGSRNSTCAVATHPGADSAEGLADMGGNVREWTASPSGRFRVLRGGSWGDSLPMFLSAEFRGMNAPDERMELLGFRCAAEPVADNSPAPVIAAAVSPQIPPSPATQPIPPPRAEPAPMPPELPETASRRTTVHVARPRAGAVVVPMDIIFSR